MLCNRDTQLSIDDVVRLIISCSSCSHESIWSGGHFIFKMETPLVTVIETLFVPIYLIYLSVSFLPRTLLNVVRSGDYRVLFSWSTFRDRWFATFWAVAGPMFAEGNTTVEPLLNTHAKGVVLDLGPGSGNWVRYFSKAVKEGTITKIYGVEPNLDQHKVLRKKVKAAGLDDVYEIVGAGAEALPKVVPAIGSESIDTVVTVQVMCSAPNPDQIIRELYSYLKPGGTWIMYEHVKTHEHGLVDRYQAALDHFWGFFFGGCNLRRPTEKMIQETGNWQEVNLKRPDDFNPWMLVPPFGGYFVKSKA